MGMGPFFKDIGGKGMALTILALTLIFFFNWAKVIVDIKLIIIWVDLNFKSPIIFSPIFGVIDKNTQLHEFIISWLFFAIITFLNFLLNSWAIILFRGDTTIFLNGIFELQIPVMTDDAILPVPTKPKFIFLIYQQITRFMAKKKPLKKGAFKFFVFSSN